MVSERKTAMEVAEEWGHIDIIEILKSAGATSDVSGRIHTTQ